MIITIDNRFNVGDRVWMPDGKGGKEKGQVRGMTLLMADLTQDPAKILSQSLNYKCVDIHGREFYYHDSQLQERKI